MAKAVVGKMVPGLKYEIVQTVGASEAKDTFVQICFLVECDGFPELRAGCIGNP